MEHFVNVYAYTPSAAADAWCVWWRTRFRTFYITAGIFIAVIIAISWILWQPLYIIYETFPVIAIIFMERNRRKLRRDAEEEYNRNFKDESPTIRVEIGENISLITPKNIERISFGDIEHIGSRDEIILLTVSGSRLVVLKKDGFLDGTPEACMAYIRRRRREERRNNTRKKH